MVKTNREHNLRLLQQKLDKETNALEQKMLDVKPWYLQGEIVATKRNENTLLEEHFDAQRHGLFKPNVQDEAVIDEYIIKAIKERMFDSPVFKVKEVKIQHKELPLQNVVQKSLVEDYESFLRKNQYVPESLSVKNDAACKLEEIGPMVVSTSNLLAPEEICPPRGEILIGKNERTLADRRRHRRKLMRIRSQRSNPAKRGKVDERQIAMAKITKMAHRPNSNIKIVK
ncbi:U3 small nucleolar ribonucleoprotein MPP10 [Schistosoma japonicum]|nr:U3 small nucleolar ribonucleoprotein MPP10 [Schistosoma japonicum]